MRRAKLPACLPAGVLVLWVFVSGRSAADEAEIHPDERSVFPVTLFHAPDTVPEPSPKADLPEALTWETYVSFGRDQGEMPFCGWFANLGVIEIQYAINNCERHGLLGGGVVAPHRDRFGNPDCPNRPMDDDPSDDPFQICPSTWGAARSVRYAIDLSEQIPLACAFLAGSDRFYHEVGTTFELAAPYEFPYQDWATYQMWPPPRQGDLGMVNDRMGICPLVEFDRPPGTDTIVPDIHEMWERAIAAHVTPGGGDEDAWPFWCHDAPPSDPVFFRLAAGASFDMVACSFATCDELPTPALIASTLSDGYALVASYATPHAVVVVGYRDGGETLLVRDSYPHDASGYDDLIEVPWDRFVTFEKLIGSVESYRASPAAGTPLDDWLLGDLDGDEVVNGLDICSAYDTTCPDPSRPAWWYGDGDWWPDDPPPAEAGYCSGCDLCDGVRYAGRIDQDHDGLAEGCDGCPHVSAIEFPDTCRGTAALPIVFAPTNDADEWAGAVSEGDGIMQCCDPCPRRAARYWDDPDGDGAGRPCDQCPNTPTSDGLSALPSGLAVPERYRGVTHPTSESDADGDTVGDICDLCPLDDPARSGRGGGSRNRDSTEDLTGTVQADSDRDGVGNDCDNCRWVDNVDQANCNEGDEDGDGASDINGDGVIRPSLGDACDPYPCVDLCQERFGRATFVEKPKVCDTSTGLERCSAVDDVQIDFCALGFESGVPSDSAQARDGFTIPTQMRGCACRPWRIDSEPAEDCELVCRQGGAGGGRWRDVLHDGGRSIPDVHYRPLYGEYESADEEFGGRGERYGRTGYREYYAGCDVAGWCATTSADRRRRQDWSWVADLDEWYLGTATDNHSRNAWFWGKPLAGAGFAGYVQEVGNSYVSHRQVRNEPVFRPLPRVRVRLGPTVFIPWTIDLPPWWLGVPLMANLDVLPPDCTDCDDFGFDTPGLQVGGILISEWDATNRNYANLAGTKNVDAVFDLSEPAIAVAIGAGGLVSDYWTFGGVESGGGYSDQMWHAHAQAALGQGDLNLAPTLWLTLSPRTEGQPWPSARRGATLAVRGAVLRPQAVGPGTIGDGALSESPAGVTDGKESSVGLVLVGGRGSNGILGDVWFNDGGLWYLANELPDAPGGLADSTATLAERKLWLFGGETADGVTAGLWWVDLDGGPAARVPESGPWPSARRGSAVAFDAVRRRLVVFGGLDGSGAGKRDVWAFSLPANSWTQLAPECTGNGCPAVTGKETAVIDATKGELTVLADPAGPDAGILSWSLADGIWQTAKELSTLPSQEDCDGDGMNDLLWGARCGSGSNGFPDYGKMRCDTDTAEVACRQPNIPAVERTGYSIPGLRAIDAADGKVVALTRRRVDVFHVAPGGVLAGERSIALPRDAYDVALWRDQALVADADGLLVVRTTDGTTAGSVDTCGKARRVFVDGNRAVVIGLRSIALVDLDEAAGPGMGQDLRVYPGPRGELNVVEETRCSWWYGLVDVACDVSGACIWSRRLPSALDDHRLFINQLVRTYELDLSTGAASVPPVVSEFRTGLLGSIAYESPYLYTNGFHGGTAVYDGRPDPPWEYAGGHDVSLWVRGTVTTSGYRFLADAEVLRVAVEQ
ncbi:MAG: hypothetical protein HY905_21955 [Deltaproteobacteria bacterium]|nr:hypothetical protein [Deltaproteobacteria bacterium]